MRKYSIERGIDGRASFERNIKWHRARKYILEKRQRNLKRDLRMKHFAVKV